MRSSIFYLLIFVIHVLSALWLSIEAPRNVEDGQGLTSASNLSRTGHQQPLSENPREKTEIKFAPKISPTNLSATTLRSPGRVSANVVNGSRINNEQASGLSKNGVAPNSAQHQQLQPETRLPHGQNNVSGAVENTAHPHNAIDNSEKEEEERKRKAEEMEELEKQKKLAEEKAQNFNDCCLENNAVMASRCNYSTLRRYLGTEPSGIKYRMAQSFMPTYMLCALGMPLVSDQCCRQQGIIDVNLLKLCRIESNVDQAAVFRIFSGDRTKTLLIKVFYCMYSLAYAKSQQWKRQLTVQELSAFNARFPIT